MNLRLPPTALGSGFDLLALRARCKREPTRCQAGVQGGGRREACNLRLLPQAQHEIVLRAPHSKGSDQKKFTEPVALLSTFPVNLRLPPRALGRASTYSRSVLGAPSTYPADPSRARAAGGKTALFAATELSTFPRLLWTAWGQPCGRIANSLQVGSKAPRGGRLGWWRRLSRPSEVFLH